MILGYQHIVCRWHRFRDLTPESGRLVLLASGDGKLYNCGRVKADCTFVQIPGGVWALTPHDMWAYFPIPDTTEGL